MANEKGNRSAITIKNASTTKKRKYPPDHYFSNGSNPAGAFRTIDDHVKGADLQKRTLEVDK